MKIKVDVMGAMRPYENEGKWVPGDLKLTDGNSFTFHMLKDAT